MSYKNNEINSTSKITNDIIITFENRKEIINKFRNKFFSKNYNENKSNKVTVDKIDLENLLDEFEYTISQSLQIIKTLEIENSNLKEIKFNKEIKEDCSIKNKYFNEIKNLNIDNHKLILNESDMINYHFQSPTNLNNFEEMSFYPRKETEDTICTFRINDNINNQNLNEDKLNRLEYNFSETFENNNKNEDENNFYEQKKTILPTNFIYHKNAKLSSFKISNSENSIHNTINSTNSNPSNKNNLFNYSKGLNLNFDYSIVAMEKFTDNSLNNNNYDGHDDKIHEQEFPNIYPEINQYENTNNFNVNHNKISNLEINNNEDRIVIKQGLRQKLIKSKSCHNSNFPSLKSTINQENESDYNIKNIPKCTNTNNTIDTECSMPYINSKRDSFSNRLQDLEKEKIIQNILNKINISLDKNTKRLLSKKYGNGSYDYFLYRLNNLGLNLEDLENDLNLIIGIDNNEDILKNNRNNNCKFNKRSKSINSTKTKPENENANVYIEPVRLESFLRNSKRPQAKINKKSY